MSITRALAELKLLSSRIENAIENAHFVVVQSGDKAIPGYNSSAEFAQKAKASLDSIQALIKRRQLIKHAIVLSNASTIVQIDNVQLTVAEAIEQKSSILLEKKLLGKIISDHDKALGEMNKENARVQERLDRLVEASFGTDVKAKSEHYEAITVPFLKKNEAKLLDPIHSRDKASELLAKITSFETEVDFVLSACNATTMIEIPE
jgi:hypothetical protein